MKGLTTPVLLTLLLLLSGCATVAQQSKAVWGVIRFKEDPVPIYVSPMFYEQESCETLQGYHQVMGRFTHTLNQQLARRMKDIAVPENKKVSQWPDGVRFVRQYNLPIEVDSTWYEAFVTAWGHYEAIDKAQQGKQCGLRDPYRLLPWQTARFSW